MNRSFWIIALITFANSLSFTILIPILYLYGRQFELSIIGSNSSVAQAVISDITSMWRED